MKQTNLIHTQKGNQRRTYERDEEGMFWVEARGNP